MDDGGPDGLFTGVIRRRNTGIVQKCQQFLSMDLKPFLQSHFIRIDQRTFKQAVQSVANRKPSVIRRDLQKLSFSLEIGLLISSRSCYC